MYCTYMMGTFKPSREPQILENLELGTRIALSSGGGGDLGTFARDLSAGINVETTEG